MNGLTEKEVLDVLLAVERGEVTIPREEAIAAEEAYCGNVTYHLSNGWVFTIFNDCGEWDYIDEVVAADGRSLSFDDISGGTPYEPTGAAMPHLYDYQCPPTCEAWGITA
jgi:hypothetical protein